VLTESEMARRIATAKGIIGTNRDYLYRTIACLTELGVADGPMFRLEQQVRALANEHLSTGA